MLSQMTSNLFLTVQTVWVGAVSHTWYTLHITSCKTAKLIVHAAQSWCWKVTVFWDMTPCSLVIICRPCGWKRSPQFRRKFLQFCGRLWCGAGAGLRRVGSGLPTRVNVRKRRVKRSTEYGSWPQMPLKRQITITLHLIPAGKTET